MKYKIVGDSCCDVDQEMEDRMGIILAPLTLEVDGVRYVDDHTFNPIKYLEKADASSQVPKTSCPSPDAYLEAMKGPEEGVFVITLGAELSGSYSSAMLGKDLYIEENEMKKIHVFNSKSAASGEAAIALKIEECIHKDMEFDDIVELVEAYISEMQTIFVLQKIDHLQKAGRMSKTKATLANVLNIKLILTTNDKGEIILHSQARGTKKALTKMVAALGEIGTINKDKILVIAQCQADERAEDVKKMVQKMYDFKDVIIVKTKGISTNYANAGGIILAY